MNIVLLEPLRIPDALLERLSQPLRDAGHSFTALPKAATEEETILQARNADIVMLGNRPFPDSIVSNLPRLKFISVAFTGVDHVGLDSCKKQGVAVSNAAGYSTDAVAELTVGAMICLLRRVLQCDNRIREGGAMDELMGYTLKGKTVGIVGTGAIGLQVARLLRAFGCTLLAYSRTKKPEALELGVQYVELDELLCASDIITLHCPLNAETKNLIDGRRIKLMKPSALFVNMARGPIVDYTALALALRDDRLAGAAVDVFEKEPPIYPGHPMLNVKNVLATPHIAYATAESMEQRAKIAFENVTAWLAGSQINKIL